MELKICSANQYYLRVKDLVDWSKLFICLTENGYKNAHDLTPKILPPYSVVCIDPKDKWFCSVNVTVMAGVVSQGKKVILASEYLG